MENYFDRTVKAFIKTETMKKLFLIITALSFLMVSCEFLDKLTQFDMDYDSSFTVISGIPVNVPFDLMTPAVQTNSESIFKGKILQRI